jgi:hypothetical protein
MNCNSTSPYISKLKSSGTTKDAISTALGGAVGFTSLEQETNRVIPKRIMTWVKY